MVHLNGKRRKYLPKILTTFSKNIKPSLALAKMAVWVTGVGLKHAQVFTSRRGVV